MSQRILAIDDEPHMLVLLERIVREKTTYDIRTTANALEVPEILDRNEFEIIVTDLKMPRFDGMEILRRIQEEGRRELVVLITAFGTVETARQARSLGAFDYITKPFRKEEILTCLERGMQIQRARECQQILDTLLTVDSEEEAVQQFLELYREKKG